MKPLFYFLIIGFSFLSCSSSDEPEVEVDKPFSFEGKWLGNWSDSLFPSISVSAIVRKTSENNYSGSMYIQAAGNDNYTAGYGGSNDGSIRFMTDSEGNVIEYTYVQTAPDYRDGCPGEYNGTGAIDEALNRLVINFTGTDCDGFHDKGKFIWRLDE